MKEEMMRMLSYGDYTSQFYEPIDVDSLFKKYMKYEYKKPDISFLKKELKTHSFNPQVIKPFEGIDMSHVEEMMRYIRESFTSQIRRYRTEPMQFVDYDSLLRNNNFDEYH